MSVCTSGLERLSLTPIYWSALIKLPTRWLIAYEFQLLHHQVDHLPEVKELADDGDWAVRIPTTVVIELEVI